MADGAVTYEPGQVSETAGLDTRALNVAYFGHDSADAAVRRRVRAMRDDGLTVTGFMPHRRSDKPVFWPNVELGETRDGDFVQRVKAIFGGAATASRDARLAKADVMIARNLDMLACAFRARARAGLDTPVIYECLDVHRTLTNTGPVGTVMRSLERALVKRCARVWVSSPGFLEHHFEVHHKGQYTADLLENRLPQSGEFGPRPTDPRQPDGPLQLGWVGMLRCQRSFDLLLAVADQFGEAVHLHLHGLPARTEVPVFEPLIDARENVTYHGGYTAPDDLAGIYAGLDAVWAGDFMEAGANSVWLLPNRIYEGGYYGTPPIAPTGTQTAAWIDARACGLTVDEPLEARLPELISRLIEDHTPLDTSRQASLALGVDTFIEPAGTLRAAIGRALAEPRS